MSFLRTFLIIIAILLIPISYFLQTSPIDSYSFSYTTDDQPLPELLLNNRLSRSAIEVFFRGEKQEHGAHVAAPEHYAFRDDGWIYTGLDDGRIVRARINDAENALSDLETILYTGDREKAESLGMKCGTPVAEPICGRPLGMQFNPHTGKLIVADGPSGLLEVDVDKKTKRVLVDTIPSSNSKMKLINSLCIGSKSGKIYFTDSSTRWTRKDFIYEAIEGQPTGRMMEYDPTTQKIRVLLEKVAFANGILVDKEEKFLIIAELNRALLIKYDLKEGEKYSSTQKDIIQWDDVRDLDDHPVVSILLQNIPGMPDNLAWESEVSPTTNKAIDSNEYFWIGLGTKRVAPFSFTDTTSRYPRIRNFLASLLPQSFFLKFVPKVGVLMRIMLTNKKSVVNPLGELTAVPVETLQDPAGSLHLLTSVYEHRGHLYIGSISNEVDFLSRVKWTKENKTEGSEWRGRV